MTDIEMTSDEERQGEVPTPLRAPNRALAERWPVIPINVWHQAVVPGANRPVVSFHSVAARELIHFDRLQQTHCVHDK